MERDRRPVASAEEDWDGDHRPLVPPREGGREDEEPPGARREVRLAIVGSTRFASDPDAAVTARRHIANAVAALHPDVVVSGGAKGIDSIAADYAREHRIPVVEHLPANRRWAPDGYKDRNAAIAADCTHLLCIRHEHSSTYGSGWTADLAEQLGRHVKRLTVQAGAGSEPARPRRARKSASAGPGPPTSSRP